jgi:predicted transposase YbfD/YdcC
MPDIHSAATNQPAPADLISFLKAIPDGRYRRGVRYPQWFLLLVAVLGILSGCRSSRDLEAFAKRHREALNQALGLDFKRWPSDATFLYLFNKAHLQEFGEVLQAWMISQIPGGAEGLDQLVCDGKTLRGSAIETEDGNHRFVAQVTVYARALDVALAQKAYDSHDSSELTALKELLSTLDLEGALIQADALHTTQAFFDGAWSRGPTSSAPSKPTRRPSTGRSAPSSRESATSLSLQRITRNGMVATPPGSSAPKRLRSTSRPTGPAAPGSCRWSPPRRPARESARPRAIGSSPASAPLQKRCCD